MYIKRIELRDVKCFERVALDFTDERSPDKIRRWTTILGTNGLGKSTLLQTIAMCAAGPYVMRDLLPRPESWVRSGASFGHLSATLVWTEGDQQVPHWPKKTPYEVGFAITGQDVESLPDGLKSAGPQTFTEWSGEGDPRSREQTSKVISRLRQTAYAEGKAGWLCCGYGPFRRLTGGSQDADQILYAERKAARFVSLFREDAALSRAALWLTQLHNLSRDGDHLASRQLDTVTNALRNDFLLERAELKVDARQATLAVGDAPAVPLTALSDGYRSMLALGLDLVINLVRAFPGSTDPLGERGVVLIDELDAHLHPNWQRIIGGWLLEKFPAVQFIVATHSPFLTQVWPDSNFILSRDGYGRVSVAHSAQRAVDWTVDQVMVDLLGLESIRSPVFEEKLARYSELRRRKVKSDAEAEEVRQLQLWADDVDNADGSTEVLRALIERLDRAGSLPTGPKPMAARDSG